MCDPPATFKFLTGRQVLSLEKLQARQALSVVPEERQPTRDGDALIYIFVSHRWDEKNLPDKTGKQLQVLQRWLRMVEELLFSVTVAMATTFPKQLEDMVEGMPQAASLVARIQARGMNKPKFRDMLRDPLDHIYLWYDCACLPQQFPAKRTELEQQEFATALKHLDWLVFQCELLCLRTTGDDYEHRAWCAFEQFQKSLDRFEGDLTIDCEKLLHQIPVDWHAVDQPQTPLPQQSAVETQNMIQQFQAWGRPDQVNMQIAIQQMQQNFLRTMSKANQVAEESRQIDFVIQQDKWSRVFERINENVAMKNMPPVPDVYSFMNQRQRMTVQMKKAPLMQNAMEQLTAELFSAVFQLSCRDAALLRKVRIPPYYKSCIPNVGIQCGLHQLLTPAQQQRWQQLVDGGGAGVDAKRPAATASTLLCERRVTIDLYALVTEIFSRFRLTCTNDGDTAFVGLLALRNLLTKDQSHEGKLKLYAGSLCYLHGVAQSAVDTLSRKIAKGERVSSLPVIVSIRVPRWVLLDMANSQMQSGQSLLYEDALHFGRKVEQYLQENPGCLSYSLPADEDAPLPLSLGFCGASADCHSSWSLCSHRIEKDVANIIGSTLQLPSGSLDSWDKIELPVPIAAFACVVADDRVFVIGGTSGEEDPETKTYTKCNGETLVARLPWDVEMKDSDGMWSTTASLIQARRNHAACVLKDNCGGATIVVGGGRSSTSPGIESLLLSSTEVLRLDDEQQQEWTPGPTIPRSRASHYMVAGSGSIFVFGGVTENPNDSRKCDIYNFSRGIWMAGPDLPFALRGRDSILVRDRYILVFGGLQGQQPLRTSLVLDIKPWTEWSAQGGSESKRPGSTSTWIPGPDLPMPMSCPNICWAPAAETGRIDNWIISVSPLETGSLCHGLRLDTTTIGMDNSAYWSSLSWHQLGATPQPTAMGASVVSKGSLAIIGGIYPNSVVSNSVHIRCQLTRHNVPLPGGPCTNMTIISGLDPSKHHRILLNDLFLAGRLGFPIHKDDDLFAPDGVKKLSLIPPARPADVNTRDATSSRHYCEHCLHETSSMELARLGNDTAMYTLQVSVDDSAVILCSSCLCALYL